MSEICFLFPGQGSQTVGMGKNFFDQDERAREFYNRADEALGFPLSKLCFEGPEEKLKLTENTQPAILTHSVIAADFLKRANVNPAYIAGHSLGEISAVTASGAISFEDGVKLVRSRGKFMQEAVPEGEGAMSAIIGLSYEELSKICQGFEPQIVSVANINSPEQIVISGEKNAVEQASAMAKESGAKMAVPLPVSAPFHCQMMKPAAEKLGAYLKDLEIRDLGVPLITNADVQRIQKGDDIRTSLIKQVEHPVRWLEIIQLLLSDGVKTFVEVGPGKVLTGFMRRIVKGKEHRTLRVHDPESAAKVISALSS
ncbi:ACP S-malonyltransferase [Acidobacteriota bacterium]